MTDIVGQLRGLPGAVYPSQKIAELTAEIARLRAALERAEAVCRALALTPPVKMTGMRRIAYETWRDALPQPAHEDRADG